MGRRGRRRGVGGGGGREEGRGCGGGGGRRRRGLEDGIGGVGKSLKEIFSGSGKGE